jgi:hypothetical protein
MLSSVLALALVCGAFSRSLRSNDFTGVLVTGQFRCDDALCPDWELDVTRVDPSFHVNGTAKLTTLVPKSPVASMNFPVFTAYHEASRTFITAALVVRT